MNCITKNSFNPSIETRVNSLKLEVYRYFIGAKEGNCIYFEEILNFFISLVQQPLNFAVFDENINPVFHFCLDIKHKDNFEAKLITDKWKKEDVFPIFPEAISEKYYIAIFLMESKDIESSDQWYNLVKPISSEVFALNNYDYISFCADLFFKRKWDGFDTSFNEIFSESMLNSISLVEENYMSNNQKKGNERRSISCVDQEIKIKYSEWKKEVSCIFSELPLYTKYGYECINHLSGGISSFSNDDIPNAILACRNFISTNNKGRMAGLYDKNGYFYNTHLIIPDSNNTDSLYYSFFSDLKNEYIKNKSNSFYEKKHNKTLFCNLYEDLDSEELSKIFNRFDDRPEFYKKLSNLIELYFWERLSSENGVQFILRSLSHPVSKYMRSLVDPVYHTGLIHINSLFDYWGFDRFDNRIFPNKIESLDDFNEDIKNDFIRLIALYYLLCRIAVFRTNKSNPRSISAFVIPIKMRGSVWGASIHSFYSFDYLDNKTKNPTWLSSFLLTTEARINTQKLIDNILWTYIQRKISEIISNNIKVSDSSSFQESIEIKTNNMIREQQLLTPYALPIINLTEGDGSRGDDYIDIEGGGGNYLRVSWEIEENLFFSARQKFKPPETKSFRSFNRAIDVGFRRGLEIMLNEVEEGY